MSLPTLQLTTGQKLAQTTSTGVSELRRHILDFNRSYTRFWGLDRTETVAAINAQLSIYLTLFQSHYALGTALNNAAAVAGLPDRAIVTTPDWIAFEATQFVEVPELEPAP